LENFKKSKGEERKCLTEDKRIKCPRCSRQYRGQFYLTHYVQMHEDFDNTQPFHCRGACSKYFVSLGERDMHELVHSGEKAFVGQSMADGTLKGCGKQFARSDVLLAHLRSDTGIVCFEEMGLNKSVWGLRKRHGETDEGGEGGYDSGDSKNVEVSETGESEPELPDEQSSNIYSHIYSESSSSSSDSESDSEPLSSTAPNPLDSQTSKADSKSKTPPTTQQLLEIATKQADKVRVAEHEKALEKAVKKGDEDRAAISRWSIDLINNGKQSQ
jgi:hypothetical protein